MEAQPVRGPAKIERPLVASGLVLLSGLILLIEGIVGSIAANAATPLVFNNIPTEAAWLGGLAAFFGFAIIMLGIYILLEPQYHLGFGIAVLAVSLITFYADSGVLIGLIFAFIGGVLAIVFRPASDPRSRTAVGGRSRSST
ncbi:MAG TPA: DUF6114 domain-containing protein [Thermoplasmata archaeon]|jgi:hypothetical protein|nr:DUF6114 domain-containing protein [Thermoplasmata archaeon]